MLSHAYGLLTPMSLGQRSYGLFSKPWRRNVPYRLKGESTQGISAYWNHIADMASFALWERHQRLQNVLDNSPSTLVLLARQGQNFMAPLETYWNHVTDAASVSAFRHNEDGPSVISAEALPENASLIDFRRFAVEYPDKLLPLLARLRPEFQELFIEYWMLGKSQNFLAKTHGCIQTRIWQQLRIIERAIGALIVLGLNPTREMLQPILEKTGFEQTEYGSLTNLILMYAQTQSYAYVAQQVKAPIPAIRKIFRPIIAALAASKDMPTVAVSYYLHNLTHQASLTRSGLSKRCLARIRRMHKRSFDAPPTDESPMLSFGNVASLREKPWNMFEIANDHHANKILAALKMQSKRLFGKNATQVFTPVDASGSLTLGYMFARSKSDAVLRNFLRVRGISEMSAVYDSEGAFVEAVTVPHEDVQKIIDKHMAIRTPRVRLGSFVKILTGDAANYCGTVTAKKGTDYVVTVSFPSGRVFLVTADPTGVQVLPETTEENRQFWGAPALVTTSE